MYDEIKSLAMKIILGVVLFLVVITLFSSCSVIDTRERGVVTRFGALTGRVLEPGLTFKAPFIESIEKIDVGVQKEQVEASAASKDLQAVSSVVALNYSINPKMVMEIVQTVGWRYKENLVDPALQEAIKAATAKFTAEELITKRQEVTEEIVAHLKQKLEPKGIIINDFNIINFDFSPSFNEAIELKVTAEQNALASKNKLEQVKYEATQKIEEAKGKAEALRVESAALQSNPEVLELRAIEKWNGQLPTFMGGDGTVPFINLPQTNEN